MFNDKDKQVQEDESTQQEGCCNIKSFIYIAQAIKEMASCKIGITDNLERRLQEYNSTTGKSADNATEYLFTCEVENARQVENDIKKKFAILRENSKREIYFFNTELFKQYVSFIKSHPLFKREIFFKETKPEIKEKVVKKEGQKLQKREKTRKDIMQQARFVKNDEFYTRYEDIEKEVLMYKKSVWKNKCVFCNCDDAVGDKNNRNENNTSAFALFFINNFEKLGLKKLICTHYGEGIDLFSGGSKGYIFTKNGFEELKDTPRGYTGSFDDPLSIKILNEEADIVCTNPPFSKCIDYWKLIIDSGKKFLIISNFTNCINTAYIKYFAKKQVWAGYNRVDWYYNPKMQLVDASGHWYTNIPINNRPKYKNIKFMTLNEIPDKYKKFDDHDVLNMYNNYIPINYMHPFAVSAYPILSGILEKGYKIVQLNRYTPHFNGKENFAKVLIQKEVDCRNNI